MQDCACQYSCSTLAGCKLNWREEDARTICHYAERIFHSVPGARESVGENLLFSILSSEIKWLHEIGLMRKRVICDKHVWYMKLTLGKRARWWYVIKQILFYNILQSACVPNSSVFAYIHIDEFVGCIYNRQQNDAVT